MEHPEEEEEVGVPNLVTPHQKPRGEGERHTFPFPEKAFAASPFRILSLGIEGLSVSLYGFSFWLHYVLGE